MQPINSRNAHADKTWFDPFPDSGVTLTSTRVENGLIFIPDITGFTQFVETTDIYTGAQVTTDLLSCMIDNNKLRLRVSEIEGDAVLFYRYGPPPTLDEIMLQAQCMVSAFQERVKKWSAAVPQAERLSVKLIVHYGAIARISITGSFHKLYGKAVIEAHTLLKNEVSADCYLLLTDEFLEAARTSKDDPACRECGSFRICQDYHSIGRICYTYVPFS